MYATRFEIRYRALITILLYVVSFVAPWHWPMNERGPGGTWGLLIAQLNRTRLVNFKSSFVLVTVCVLVCAWSGSLIRLWARAVPGNEALGKAVSSPVQTIRAGHNCTPRRAFYLGEWLLALPVATLMRPAAATFLMIALTVFLLRLSGARPARNAYDRDGQRVPGVLPAETVQIPATKLGIPWRHAAVTESYGLLLATTFSIYCWSFDAQLLLRWVLVSFGLSMVLNALVTPPQRQSATA